MQFYIYKMLQIRGCQSEQPLICMSIAPTHFNDGKRNMNAGKTRLQSTAVYGRTIFWKGTK